MAIGEKSQCMEPVLVLSVQLDRARAFYLRMAQRTGKTNGGNVWKERILKK